jgi:sugar (pentulose or hexulose) kinase
MQNYFIGIDLGTGSTKAVAVDTAGNVLCILPKIITQLITRNPVLANKTHALYGMRLFYV